MAKDKKALPADWKGNPDGTPKIVEAGVAMTAAGGLGLRPGLAKEIEAAMSQAILDAAKEGIGMDQPDVIRARMLEARQRVLADPKASPQE